MSEQLSGRDLDAVIAERVMNWTRHPEAMHPTDNRTIQGVLYCRPEYPAVNFGGALNVVPEFSTSIEAAMQVLAKFSVWNINKTDHPDFADKPYSVFVGPVGHEHSSRIETFEVQSASISEGICRAALKALDSQKGS